MSPGLRADTGVAGAVVGGTPAPALHATIGASLASIVEPEKFPADIGLGYVLFLADPNRPVNGLYLDGAWLRRVGAVGRISLGARAELLFQDRTGLALGSGGAVRFGIEALKYTSGEFAGSSVSNGGFTWVGGWYTGTAAYGLSAEVGVRRLPGAIFSYYAMVGLTVRLPTAFGLALIIPFPK